MLLRWVTAAYLAYIVVPIALLIGGSFGELWLNTILPTGFTGGWYREVAADPSFRRAWLRYVGYVPGGGVGSPAAGRLVNGRLPEDSTVIATGRCWPRAAESLARPFGREHPERSSSVTNTGRSAN